jgi:hypothetical protein
MKTIITRFAAMVASVVEIKNKTDLLIVRNLKVLAKIEAIVISMAN